MAGVIQVIWGRSNLDRHAAVPEARKLVEPSVLVECAGCGGTLIDVPMPKRESVDDYFAQLNDVQRSHLETLRALSLDADPEAREELKWNLPVYVRGEKTNLWMLQNFKNHCSLRFSPPFFAAQKAAVEAAGYEAGEGFIKLPYDRDLPTELLKALMQARVEEYEATSA